MTQPTYASAAEAKKAGWFSRRHRDNAAHIAAREAYKARKQTARKDREK